MKKLMLLVSLPITMAASSLFADTCPNASDLTITKGRQQDEFVVNPPAGYTYVSNFSHISQPSINTHFKL